MEFSRRESSVVPLEQRGAGNREKYIIMRCAGVLRQGSTLAFGEHPQGLEVLHDIASLVGHEQQEEVLDRLVHVPDRLRLDERVLLVACVSAPCVWVSADRFDRTNTGGAR